MQDESRLYIIFYQARETRKDIISKLNKLSQLRNK